MEKTVQYLNLRLNYGNLITCRHWRHLNDNPSVKQELYSYGRRLSLGYNDQLLVGEPDVDYWTQNAREFKRVAFGEQENLWHALWVVIQVPTERNRLNSYLSYLSPLNRLTDEHAYRQQALGFSAQVHAVPKLKRYQFVHCMPWAQVFDMLRRQSQTCTCSLVAKAEQQMRCGAAYSASTAFKLFCLL